MVFFRRTAPRLRLFGVGVKDSQRHREAKFERLLDGFKMIGVVSGIAFAGVWGMSALRAASVAVNPKGSAHGMRQRMDDALISQPNLAAAAAQMALHYSLADVRTPFGAPMVAPPHLAEEARELEGLVAELMTYSHEFSPADLWAMIASKAVLLLGGPDCVMKAGRPLDAASMSVRICEPVVPYTERNAARLKSDMVRRGYRVSDVVAVVGAMRSLGYHPDAKVRFHAEEKTFVGASSTSSSSSTPTSEAGTTAASSSSSASDHAVFRKTTTHPFTFSNDYFDSLVQYQWRPETEIAAEAARAARASRGILGRIGLLGGSKDAKAASGADAPSPNVFRCDDQRLAELRVKYVISAKAPTAPQTREQAEAEEEAMRAAAEGIAAADPQLSICDQISMQPIDLSLLDDTLMSGWANRFADNEPLFFLEVAKVLEASFVNGYPHESLHRTYGV